MDMMIMAVVAILTSIIALLIAMITKKSKWNVLLFATIGLIIGMPLGYFLAPFVISFF